MPPMSTAVSAANAGNTGASGWPRTGEPYISDNHVRVT
jgi:hypothetical protein